MLFMSDLINSQGSQNYRSNVMLFPELQICVSSCLLGVTLKLFKTSNSTCANKIDHLLIPSSKWCLTVPVFSLSTNTFSWSLQNSLSHSSPLFDSFNTRYLFIVYPMMGSVLGDGDVVVKKRDTVGRQRTT